MVEVVVSAGTDDAMMEEEGYEDFVDDAEDDVVGEVVGAVVGDVVGEVVMAALVDDGFGVVDVTTGLGMKNPWAQTRPQPSKQHLPDLTPWQSASDLQSS